MLLALVCRHHRGVDVGAVLLILYESITLSCAADTEHLQCGVDILHLTEKLDLAVFLGILEKTQEVIPARMLQLVLEDGLSSLQLGQLLGQLLNSLLLGLSKRLQLSLGLCNTILYFLLEDGIILDLLDGFDLVWVRRNVELLEALQVGRSNLSEHCGQHSLVAGALGNLVLELLAIDSETVDDLTLFSEHSLQLEQGIDLGRVASRQDTLELLDHGRLALELLAGLHKL